MKHTRVSYSSTFWTIKHHDQINSLHVNKEKETWAHSVESLIMAKVSLRCRRFDLFSFCFKLRPAQRFSPALCGRYPREQTLSQSMSPWCCSDHTHWHTKSLPEYCTLTTAQTQRLKPHSRQQEQPKRETERNNQTMTRTQEMKEDWWAFACQVCFDWCDVIKE